jgi:hypothetical protein
MIISPIVATITMMIFALQTMFKEYCHVRFTDTDVDGRAIGRWTP